MTARAEEAMKRKISIAMVMLAACSSAGGNGGNNNNNTTPDAPAGSNSNSPDAPTTGSAKATIFTIVLENHDYAEIVGSSNAPYINSLIAQGGLATKYKDTAHPSLPNY